MDHAPDLRANHPESPGAVPREKGQAAPENGEACPRIMGIGIEIQINSAGGAEHWKSSLSAILHEALL